MSKEKTTGIGFLERYLTLWVAITTIVGVLVEVPVMLMLVKVANKTRGWFPT